MSALLPAPLVDAAWLAERIGHPALRILECTVGGELTDESHARSGRYRLESGRPLWEQGHVPGSDHVDLLDELSDPEAPVAYMMPSADRFARAMERHGVGDDTEVVLYDRGPTQEAARVWWMLRSIGFDAAAVLDGGWPKWTGEGRPTSTASPRHPFGRLTVRERSGCFVAKRNVAEASRSGRPRLVNVLSEREFAGTEARYGRPGRIPGSVNLPYGRLLDSRDGTLVPAQQCVDRLAEAGVRPGEPVVTYCGGGLAAAFVAFALTAGGREDVAVYDGSMLEWAADPELPLECG